MFASRLSGVRRMTEDLRGGSCHSVYGVPKFQRVRAGLKGMSCLSVLWVFGGYSEVIDVNDSFGMWNY